MQRIPWGKPWYSHRISGKPRRQFETVPGLPVRRAHSSAGHVRAPRCGLILIRGGFRYFGRQLYDGEPEVLDGLHHLHELPQVDRLSDIAVGVQPVGFENIFFPGGQRQYYDGNELEVVIGLDLRQYLAAILLRQVEVEQDQIGPRRRGPI